jgi:hypothetical protein
MNFLIRILINGISAYYFVSFLPWWSIIFIPFLLGYLINENNFNHFLSGFIGIGIAWIFLIININSGNESIISEKIIQILNVESVNLLTIYSSIIGGCIGGFASITGLSFKRIFIKNKPRKKFNF